MADTNGFAKMVPGFEFMQSLAKNAGGGLPNMGQWVAPTLNPEEIEKRIEELRTVKFWLEQNGRMLDATIQALEVQRMTLSTLKTMNVQMTDLRDAMMIRKPSAEAAPAASTTEFATSAMAAAAAFANAFQFPKPASDKAAAAGAKGAHEAPPVQPTAAPAETQAPMQDAAHHEPSAQGSKGAGPGSPAPGATQATAPAAIDPMQWWNALTRQFTTLATSAMQDGASARPEQAPTEDSADPAPKGTVRTSSLPRKKAVRRGAAR